MPHRSTCSAAAVRGEAKTSWRGAGRLWAWWSLGLCVACLGSWPVGGAEEQPAKPAPPAREAPGGAAATAVTAAHSDVPAEGRVGFEITPLEPQIPERFRLATHEFAFQARNLRSSGTVAIHAVTFPSPVTTDIPENNTVHAEYFQPAGAGPFPGVVVLHILGGEFPLSQAIAQALARRGVAALFIKLPYYGERRSATNKRRMISRIPEETVAGMTQGVLDVRRGIGWLRARPEVDDQDLGVTGISLGGLMSALSGAAEPRIRKVGVLLAGGELAQNLWDHPVKETGDFRQGWLARGGTRQSFIETLAPCDPVTHAHLLRGKQVLIVAAEDDEVFPRSSTLALHQAIGAGSELVWLKGVGHYTSLLYIFRETDRLGTFMLRQR